MQFTRRGALRVLGAALGGSVLSGGPGRILAAPSTSYIDHYCYCSDMLVSVGPDAALKVIDSGDDHTLWASSIKREVSPGLWVGRSIFTGKESIHLRFKVDPARYLVDYMAGGAQDTIGTMQLVNWARVLPGKVLGYREGTSLVALYQPRRAGTDLQAFLEGRNLHAAEMYRIKLLAEHGAATPANGLLTGEYLASYSEQVSVPPDTLFDFISDGKTYGKYTWGRSPRSLVAPNVYRCKSDFGEPGRLVRFEVDRDRKTVDYYVGAKSDAMRLTQSARVFSGTTFGYDAKVSLVTFTRWRAAGQSDFDWDRAVVNQVEETNMTKGVLENEVRG
jgi:hypothetical protein